MLKIFFGPEEEHSLINLDRLRVEIYHHVLAIIKQFLCCHLAHEPEIFYDQKYFRPRFSLPDKHCITAYKDIDSCSLLGGFQYFVRPEQSTTLQTIETALIIVFKLFIIVELCKNISLVRRLGCRMCYRELRSLLGLVSQIFSDGSPLFILLGHDGELEPPVILEQRQHTGGHLGVRGLHPSEGRVPGQEICLKFDY